MRGFPGDKAAKTRTLLVLISSDGDYADTVTAAQQAGFPVVIIAGRDGHPRKAFLQLVPGNRSVVCWEEIVEMARGGLVKPAPLRVRPPPLEDRAPVVAAPKAGKTPATPAAAAPPGVLHSVALVPPVAHFLRTRLQPLLDALFALHPAFVAEVGSQEVPGARGKPTQSRALVLIDSRIRDGADAGAAGAAAGGAAAGAGEPADVAAAAAPSSDQVSAARKACDSFVASVAPVEVVELRGVRATDVARDAQLASIARAANVGTYLPGITKFSQAEDAGAAPAAKAGPAKSIGVVISAPDDKAPSADVVHDLAATVGVKLRPDFHMNAANGQVVTSAIIDRDPFPGAAGPPLSLAEKIARLLSIRKRPDIAFYAVDGPVPALAAVPQRALAILVSFKAATAAAAAAAAAAPLLSLRDVVGYLRSIESVTAAVPVPELPVAWLVRTAWPLLKQRVEALPAGTVGTVAAILSEGGPRVAVAQAGRGGLAAPRGGAAGRGRGRGGRGGAAAAGPRPVLSIRLVGTPDAVALAEATVAELLSSVRTLRLDLRAEARALLTVRLPGLHGALKRTQRALNRSAKSAQSESADEEEEEEGKDAGDDDVAAAAAAADDAGSADGDDDEEEEEGDGDADSTQPRACAPLWSYWVNHRSPGVDVLYFPEGATEARDFADAASKAALELVAEVVPPHLQAGAKVLLEWRKLLDEFELHAVVGIRDPAGGPVPAAVLHGSNANVAAARKAIAERAAGSVAASALAPLPDRRLWELLRTAAAPYGAMQLWGSISARFAAIQARPQLGGLRLSGPQLQLTKAADAWRAAATAVGLAERTLALSAAEESFLRNEAAAALAKLAADLPFGVWAEALTGARSRVKRLTAAPPPAPPAAIVAPGIPAGGASAAKPPLAAAQLVVERAGGKTQRTRIVVRAHDFRHVAADAVINSANGGLQNNAGIALAIARAAGPDFPGICRDALASRPGQLLPAGQALATASGNLLRDSGIAWVLHCVVPRAPAKGAAPPDWAAASAFFSDAIVSALACADECGAASVAVPLVGAGMYGWPGSLAARLTVEAVARWASAPRPDKASVRRVVLCDVNAAATDDFAAALRVLGPAGGGGAGAGGPAAAAPPVAPLPKPKALWSWSWDEKGRWQAYDYDQVLQLDAWFESLPAAAAAGAAAGPRALAMSLMGDVGGKPSASIHKPDDAPAPVYLVYPQPKFSALVRACPCGAGGREVLVWGAAARWGGRTSCCAGVGGYSVSLRSFAPRLHPALILPRSPAQDGGRTHPFTQENKKSRFTRAVKREPIKPGEEYRVPLYTEALVAHGAAAAPGPSAIAAPWHLILESNAQLLRFDSSVGASATGTGVPPAAAAPAPAPAAATASAAWPANGVLLATLRVPDATAVSARLDAAAARITSLLDAGRCKSKKPFSLADLAGAFTANVEAARDVVKEHDCELVDVDAGAASVRVRGLGAMTVLRAEADLLVWIGNCLVAQRDEAVRKASIEYPAEWESDGGAPFDPTVPGYVLKDVAPGSREHADVLARFKFGPSGAGRSFDKAVTRVQRVQNPLAWSRYYTQRRAIAELAANKGNPNELCVRGSVSSSSCPCLTACPLLLAPAPLLQLDEARHARHAHRDCRRLRRRDRLPLHGREALLRPRRLHGRGRRVRRRRLLLRRPCERRAADVSRARRRGPRVRRACDRHVARAAARGFRLGARAGGGALLRHHGLFAGAGETG